MKYIFTIFVFLLLSISTTSAEQAKDLYFEKLPADFIKKINFENPIKLRFDHTPENYNTVVNLIQIAEEESLALHYLCDILDTNKSIEMVPAIMRIVNDHRLVRTTITMWDGPDGSGGEKDKHRVSNMMIVLLEKIYLFRIFFDESSNSAIKDGFHLMHLRSYYEKVASNWKQLWQKDSLNFRTWGENFYKQTLQKIDEADSLECYHINYIVDSKFRRNEDTTVWKNSLRKIIPGKYFYLKTDNVFKVDSLEQLEHLMSRLGSFSELFEYLEPLENVPFHKIYAALSTYNEVDQGEIITSLLSYEYIQKAILEHPERAYFVDDYIKDRVFKFREYYSNKKSSDSIFSPFDNMLEEKGDILFSKKNINNPPLYFFTLEKMDTKSKIYYIMDTLKGHIQKIEFQKLLETATYKDLSIIIQNYSKFSRIYPYWNMFETLTFSIGISMDNYTKNDFPTLLRILNKYDEYPFFKRHSKKLYPKLFSKEELNYQLISKELESPLALKYDKENKLEYSPVLTLIRILELENNTWLGFKYQFDRNNPKQVQKRINAWIEYLENKGKL